MKYNTIHQSWSTNTLPAKYLKIKIKNKHLLKDFKFKLWSDEDNYQLIKNSFPSFLDIYNNYTHKIHRVDAVRYFYLYKYGGIYMDLDIVFKRDITSIIDETKCCLFSQKAIDDYFSNKSFESYIDPMLMYSPPNNKFIEKIIKKLHDNGVYKKDIKNIYNNMEVAGPGFLTKLCNEESDDIYIIKNKIVTKKNVDNYSDIYGIHLCDNNWVK